MTLAEAKVYAAELVGYAKTIKHIEWAREEGYDDDYIAQTLPVWAERKSATIA